MRHASLGLLAALAVRCSIQSLVVIAAFGTAGIVRAQDEAQVQEWPRFHIGVAVGYPHWSVDIAEAGISLPDPIIGPNKPAEPGTGGKFIAGFRPLRVVGVEIQYVDFGEGDTLVHGGWSVGGGQGGTSYEHSSSMKARFDAGVLTALLFIPVAKPGVDFYGKVGVADLQESITTTTVRYACVPLSQCRSTVQTDVDQSGVRPYIGMGARFKVGRAMGVRIEYEAIDRDVGDDTAMFSLGIAWER